MGNKKVFNWKKGLVSVIIVNWNGMNFLPGCLNTLQNQTYKNIEIIVVDNASKDASVQYINENFPRVQLFCNKKNLGFAVGNHVGLKYCKGEFVFLLNNDTELHPEVIARLVDAIKDDKVAGACGKILSLTNKEKCLVSLPKIDALTGKAVGIMIDSPMRKVDYLAGNSMMVKKSVIDHVGFLDKAYFAYYEETDLCARMIKAGYDLLYVPEVLVWHKEMGSTPSWFNRYYMMRNQIRFVIKNFDLMYIPEAVIGNNFRGIIRAFLKKNESSKVENKQKPKLEQSQEQKSNEINSNTLPFSVKKLLLRALLWNLIFLPQTIYCRLRDNFRIGYPRISYNENLPLRNFNIGDSVD